MQNATNNRTRESQDFEVLELIGYGLVVSFWAVLYASLGDYVVSLHYYRLLWLIN